MTDKVLQVPSFELLDIVCSLLATVAIGPCFVYGSETMVICRRERAIAYSRKLCGLLKTAGVTH